MSRAISRDSFNELKNYLGVYMQQGRVLLDADWNENQDITVSAMRRVILEALGDGTPNGGFAIQPIVPPPSLTGAEDSVPPVSMAKRGHPIFFFLNHPGDELEGFESASIEEFKLTAPDGSPAKGHRRIVEGKAYEGTRYLRVSGHSGTVRVMKEIGSPANLRLATSDIVTFRFRVNTPSAGTIKFVVKDAAGHETRWRNRNTAFASNVWLSGFAMPLDVTDFRILTTHLPAAVLHNEYDGFLLAVGGELGTTGLQWSIEGLPPGSGLAIVATEDTHLAVLKGTPEVDGQFELVIRVTDANQVVKELTLDFVVLPAGKIPTRDVGANVMRVVETRDGVPADLNHIVEWGFEIFQDDTSPLVWDFDDVRVGNQSTQSQSAQTDFIVRSSELPSLLSLKTVDHAFGLDDPEEFQRTVTLLRPLLRTGERTLDTAGRFYVAGLPCVQSRDIVYSAQRDPKDPPYTPPEPGRLREDLVYLDAWTENVTYVDDPQIREIALGGSDTATRTVVRHRIRVAENTSTTPNGDEFSTGRLTTEGSYTALVNRLYRVEIDESGGLDTATFRWADDNASTIQRVIQSIPKGSTTVAVEDASAFHAGDSIVIATAFDTEGHLVSLVTGNDIVLQKPTVSDFAISDRPRVERWNAVGVSISIDSDDRAFSHTMDLNDGVTIRFDGGTFVKGDYWTFRTRHLAGDERAGHASNARLERLDSERPHRIVHHTSPLASLNRSGQKLVKIEDRRLIIDVAPTKR